MRVRQPAVHLAVLCLVAGVSGYWSPAAAQVAQREPPGPYVIDLRGSTSGLPTASPFYPPLGETVAVAPRGFGFDAGAHVYLATLGPARIGVGASFAQIRGTSSDASATVRLLAPQLSVNFGSAAGWSYLSAGVGTGRVDTEVRRETTSAADSGSVPAINLGGGARWFLTDRAAVGFDVRFHRLAAGEPRGTIAGTPQVTLMTVSVGVSLK